MISRSLKNVLNKKHNIAQAQKLLMQTPSRAAGGGPAKPPMPSSERDFDIVLVGKYYKILSMNIPSQIFVT